MIDVSIIIVSWNTREFLLQCLQSIVETSKDCTYDITVVDNNSSDGSVEAVEKNFPAVKVIQTGANLGFAKANNIGIKESSGRYLCLVNSDVELLPDCVDKLVRYLDGEPRVGLAGPQVLYEDRSVQPSVNRFPTLWHELCTALALDGLFPRSSLFNRRYWEYWANDEVRDVEVLAGCFWLARREALDTVGLLDEHFFFYGEDVDWCLRFHRAGWRVVFYPPAMAIHYFARSSSRDPGRFWVQGQMSRLVFWRKHYGLPGYLTCLTILALRNTLRLVAFWIVDVIRGDKVVHDKWRWSLTCLIQLWRQPTRRQP